MPEHAKQTHRIGKANQAYPESICTIWKEWLLRGDTCIDDNVGW
jgi:hypothetical protein